MKNTARCALAGALLVQTLPLAAADWSQYRGGPGHNGIATESVNLSWPAEGPKVLWKVPTQNGFSSFSVAGDKAFIQVNRGIQGTLREILLALNADTGKELWTFDIGLGKYDSGGDSGAKGNDGGDGPRSTPTVCDGKVYVFSQALVLSCLEANTGKVLWQKDLLKEHAGRNIGWKSAMSPVIDDNLVFVGGGGAGQSLLAFDKDSGQVVWKAFNETITHATPVVGNLHGVRQVIFFLKSGLLAVTAKEGKELWRFPFTFKVSTAASPVIAGDIVYCSAGYGVGGGACKITKNGDKFTATQLYKIEGDKKIANHWSTPVYKDGYLYGLFSFKAFGVGPFKCVEVATGQVKWEKPGFGAGQAILVNDKVVALTDDGRVVVVEATPDGYKEVAQAKVLTGKCWSTPALANGRLYVRSTKEGACLDLGKKLAAQ
jgi:outer membrane protein assembly factor BamB